MTSDFLCPVTEIFIFALILLFCIPRVISMSLPFPWSQLDMGSPKLWFRLCSRSFPIIVHLPDWNRETDLFQHIYEWNPFFFNENRVCSLPNTVHHHPGQECPKCEWAALLIPEPQQAFTLPVPGQSCHFLDQNWEIQPQEDVTQDPGLCGCTHCVLLNVV